MKDNKDISRINKKVDSMKDSPIKESIKKDLIQKSKNEILK